MQHLDCQKIFFFGPTDPGQKRSLIENKESTMLQAKSDGERDEWMQLARNLVRHNPGLLDRFHPGVFAGRESQPVPTDVNVCREMALLWRDAEELLRLPGDLVDTSAHQVRAGSTDSSHRSVDSSLGRRGGGEAGCGGRLPLHRHRAR